MTGDPRRTVQSLLSLDFAMPLLRGSGTAVADEPLTQAERTVVYELRNFVRFQQTFAVDVASRYYRLLQQRDTVSNEYNNYQNLVAARKRAEALSGDRLPEFQVDQAKQDELRARNRYILAVEQYQSDVDSFKLLICVPLGDGLEFDTEPLRQLGRTGVFGLNLNEEVAYDLALAKRLDVLTEIDRLTDSKRKVKVAEDRLRADLRLVASSSLPSEKDTDFERFDRRNIRGNVGLNLDLPLDRVAEANGYRASLIDFERQVRAVELSLDALRDALRRDLRSLDQSRKSYQIQTNSVELATRRVESANLLLLAGRAEIRDLLEAQNSLLQARNDLTASMVNFHLVRLSLMRDLGTVELNENGLVETLDLSPYRLPVGTPEAPMEEEVIRPEQLFAP